MKDAVRAAAEVYFSPYWESKAVRQPINDIYNAVGWASHRRDDIAHGVVWGDIKIDNRSFGAFHMPPEYNTGRTHFSIPEIGDPLDIMRVRYRYTSADISSFALKFNELRQAIWDYKYSIKKVDGRIQLIDAMLRDGRIT